jgi:branched-chain amino acid transport system substrate-binding protein
MKFRSRFILLSLTALAFVGCVSKDTPADSIVLGAVLPLTGSAAQWGVPARDAISMAVDEVNSQGGGIRGKKLRLVVEDDQCQPATGVSAFQKILASSHPIAVIGAVCSGVTLAIAPVAEREKLVLFSPASTSPALTTAGDYIFRDIPSDAFRGKVFANYVFSSGHKNISVLYINNDGGVGGQQSFSESFTKLGGNIASVDAYPPDTQDLRGQLTKIKGTKSEGVLIVSYPADTPLLLRQAFQLGLHKPLFFQTEALDDPAVLAKAGNAAEGATYILPARPEGTANEEFTRKYKAKFNRDPELFAAESYDAVMLIKNCLADGSTISPDAIKAGLYKTQNYNGASGTISFDSNGDVAKPMVIKRVINGIATVAPQAN